MVSGPTATMMLGDKADVIKVEPLDGELIENGNSINGMTDSFYVAIEVKDQLL